jgi:hypothetical protein
LLALAVGGLAFWMLRSEVPAERATSPVEPASLALPATSERVDPLTAESLSVDRLSGEPPLADRVPEPALPSLAPAGLASISGNCRAAEDRAPLGGVRVRARYVHDVLFSASTTSDAAGRFELALPRKLIGRKLAIVLEGEGRVSTAHSVDGLAEGAHLELGELELPSGARCFGRVVDPEGEPVVGAEVRYGDPVTSDAAGRFRCVQGFANGTHQVPIVATGFLDAVFSLELPLVEEPVLTLVRAPSIEGYTLDEQGRPIAGVRVHAVATKSCCEVASDAAGRFAIYNSCGAGDYVTLVVLSELAEKWESQGSVAWGTRDLLVSLQRRFGIDLEVVDRETGAPVESFAVIQLARTQRPESTNLQQAGRHPGGKLRVSGVPRGERRLWVVPEDPRWMPHEREDFVLEPDAALALRVELERRPELSFLVRDTSGAPIANAELELLRSPLDRELRVTDPTMIDGAGLLRSKNGECVLLDRGRSDEQGRATLHGVIDRPQLAPPRGGIAAQVHPPLFARVLAEDFAPQLVRVPFEVATGAPVSIVLVSGAVLEGEVLPVEMLENAKVHLRLIAAENAKSPQAWMKGRAREIDKSGRFRFDSLASGELELHAAIDGLWLPKAVTSVSLRESETSFVRVDLSGLRPARFEVEVQGGSREHGVELWTLPDAEPSRRVPVAGNPGLDRNGASEELRVLPGTYVVLLARAPDGERRTSTRIVLGTAHFAPGETYVLRYELHLRALVLRLRSAEGAPLPAGTKVVLREGPIERELVLDSRGEARIDPGPTTAFSLGVNGAILPRGGLFHPPAGTEAWELDLELPR